MTEHHDTPENKTAVKPAKQHETSATHYVTKTLTSQTNTPQKAHTPTTPGWAVVMWSAAVLEPAFPGRRRAATGSPVPPGPWSTKAVSGWWP